MGIRRALSQSLATKVILSTVLLSFGVISLVGSALNSRLSDGLRSAAFNSAISESKFTFFDAEYKLAISRDSTTEARKKILADIVVNATTQVVKEARREIIFLLFNLRNIPIVATSCRHWSTITTGIIIV